MIKIYQDNGLPFYDQAWIRDRRYAEAVLENVVCDTLERANKAWDFHKIEAPCLIPEGFINPEYLSDDNPVYFIDGAILALKPETTASSYEYAKYLLEHQTVKPPFCVYQASKSFRRENDQVTKNVRLKEFYQMEFQCIVTKDTKMDYQNDDTLKQLRLAVERLTGKQARIVVSDRLPSYSEKTLDIEVNTGEKWLEVCSISKRHDVPLTWNDKELVNYEFAFGLDRLVYAMHQEGR